MTTESHEKPPAGSSEPAESEDEDSVSEERSSKPSIIKRLWRKLDLDLETALMMAKSVVLLCDQMKKLSADLVPVEVHCLQPLLQPFSSRTLFPTLSPPWDILFL
jgi:hypothetical protein